ncbi:MAG: 2-C-methyl-D-erythritol 4-phosphate cytidylyltransferase [Acidobacteria bacterium]|nr:2-C-methyl-D-erythritol 4-phosphate cytidylyltransferase [Acidobacteriota bacterium]
MNTAIIVAAGSGNRFGGETPKQFIEVAGKPLLIHTLARFEECAAIDAVVLVLSAERVSDFAGIAKQFALTKLKAIVAGGATRAESVRNGLRAVGDNCNVVAVHDGARPLVTADEISATVRAAEEFGAACLTAAVTDTIKEVSDGGILRTVDRARLRRALTPQAFRLELLNRAYEHSDLGDAATDECYLVEKLGVAIRIVDGNARNIKVTTPDDLKFVEQFL